MILILTRECDEHADQVMDVLRRKGADCVRLETAQFPTTVNITSAFEGCRTRKTVVFDERIVDASATTAVWNRRPLPPVASSQLSSPDQEFVRTESWQCLNGFLHSLNTAFWVNGLSADRAASYKVFQLEVAHSVGLEIPSTLITNDPAEVLRFYDQCGQQMIYKTFSGHVRGVENKGYGIYTSIVRRDDLVERLEEIRLSPCLFQQFIHKKFDVRVTAIGRKLFATAILSQESALTTVDWRRCVPNELSSLRHRWISLPEYLEDQIHAFMERLGLVFGCLDFVMTPDERLLFLEVNPSGQWIWIEVETGAPLLECFSEMLIQGRADYNVDAALLQRRVEQVS